MIPILYSSTEIDYTHNGIAPLKESIKANVTEEANGLLELYLEYPINGMWSREIKDQMLIKAKPNDLDEPHVFRIYEIVKNMEEQLLYIYASSKTNDLGLDLVKSATVTNATGQEAMNVIKANLTQGTTLTLGSDIATRSSTKWSMRNPLNCIVGEEGSIVQWWGGELKRNNDGLYLYARRGRDNVAVIRQGKNLEGFDMTVSTQGLITRILPHATVRNAETGEESEIIGSIVDSPRVGNYPVRRIVAVDYTDESITTLAQLNSAAASYFTDRNPDSDKPTVRFKIDMVQLSNTSYYAKFKKLESVGVFDTVTVYVPKFDVNVNVKIRSVEYDVLREKTIRIVAGDAVSDIFKDIRNDYTTIINDTTATLHTIIQQAANGNNRIWRGISTPVPPHKKGDLWYKPVGEHMVMLQWDGLTWVEILNTEDMESVKREVDAAVAEAEEAKQAAEQSYADSVAEAERLVQAQTDAFNAQMTGVNQEISTVKTNINDRLLLVNQEISNNFTSLSDSISTVSDISAQAKTDAQTALSNAATALGQAQIAISQLGGLSGKITNVEQDIDDINGILSSKVSVTDFNSLSGTVTTLSTTQTQQATLISQKANKSTVDTLTGRVSTAEGQISTQAGQIALRVTETQAQTIANTAVDGISTGRRNLVLKSGVARSSTAYYMAHYYLSEEWVKGEEYVIVVKANYIEGKYLGAYASLGTIRIVNLIYDTTLGVYIGKSVYLESHPEVTKIITIYQFPNDGAKMDIEWISVTKGNISYNDWIPAPEDTIELISSVSSELSVEKDKITSLLTRTTANETAITQVKATADGTKTTVANHAGRLTTVETNVNGLQTTVANKAEQSQVTQMANSLTSIVTSLNGVSSGGKNLLTNGSFENWASEYGFIGWGQYSGTSSSSVSHSGSNALYIGASSGYKAQQDIPVIPGNTYEIKAWVQTSSNANGTSNNQKLRIGNYDGGALLTDLGWNGAKTEWTELSKEWTVPAGVTMIRVNITSNHTVGWVRWDDVSIIDITNEKATQSKFTQLSAQINLRVAKGSVVSQINLEAEQTLISSNKLLLDANTYIMGTTFANDVKAKSLEAITANITSIRSQVLVTDSVTSTHIKADAALINSIFATTALITTLTSKTAFINNIKAIELSASKITSGTLNSTIVNAISLNVSQLVGNTTNFVQSNWNNANASIAIDATNGITARNTANTFYTRLTSGLIYFGDDANTTVGSVGSMVREGSTVAYRGIGIYIENGKEFGVAKRWTTTGAYEYIMRSAINSRGLDILTPLSVRATMNMHGNQIHNADRIYFGDTTEGIMRYSSDNTLIFFGSQGVRLGNGNATNYTTRVHVGSTTTTIHNNLTVNSDATFNANLNMGTQQITNVNSIVMQGGTTGLSRSATNTAVVTGYAGVYLSFGTVSSWSQRIFAGDSIIRFFRNLDMNSYTITGQSDVRLKHNIVTTTEDALSNIRNTRFVNFEWIDPEKPRGTRLGVIAQETMWLVSDPNADILSIDLNKQVMNNSLAIQQLDRHVQTNASKIKALEARVEELELLLEETA